VSKRLNIGVDARPLMHPKSGIGRYTYNLLERLVLSDHNWILYADNSLVDAFSSYDNVSIRSGNMSNSLSGLFYSQLIFPIWAAKDNLDIYWSPRHHLPLFLPNSIFSFLSIFDLVWKNHPRTMTFFGRLQEALLMPASISKANKVVVASYFIKSELSHHYPHVSERIDVVEGASSFDEIISDSNNLSENLESYFLFVGTVEPRKNLARLLLAYKNFLKKTDKDIRLKIVGGDGWGGVDLKALLKKEQLEDCVDIIAGASDDDLLTLYKFSYALAMPSLYEGFGLPVVEAMKFGVPVIISENSSMVEIGGSAAVLVDPYSISSIQQGLTEIANDEALRQRLSVNALMEANRYCWDRSSSKLESLFVAFEAN
jgi:glycosyltransferase involved in cell wall biosynthesis